MFSSLMSWDFGMMGGAITVLSLPCLPKYLPIVT
jgi:hypothetical protein